MQNTLVTLLPQLATLRISGADADSFLQGQLSNDLALLTPQRAQLTSYNSPKGRMLAVFHLRRDADGTVLAEVERSILDPVLKRLRMYVLRAKVALEDISAQAGVLSLAGAGAPGWLAQLQLPAPEQALDCAHHSERGVTVMRRFGDCTRYTLHGSHGALTELMAELAVDADGAQPEDWRRLDILAGVPTIYPQTSDHFVPQMANLDLLDGISFSKGCYTGQEIVARLHYLGQLKRRMVVCRCDSVEVAPGTPVHDGDEAQAVGEVVHAAPNEKGNGSLVAIVLQLAHAGSSQLCLGQPRGAPLSVPEQGPLA
ncbi:MAG: YgfZ/GcvT domain-containing protein [Stenotrophobium sp.]